MIKTFKHEDKVINFHVTTGEVMSSVKKVIVQGSGGGGSVTDGNGTISPVKIDSNVQHEIWLKITNGSEKDFLINNSKIPLRDGHKISVITVDNNAISNEGIIAVVNHTAKKHWILYDLPTIIENLNIISKYKGCALTITIPLLLFLMTYIFFSINEVINNRSIATSIGVIIVFLSSLMLIEIIKKIRKNTVYNRNIESHFISFLNKLITNKTSGEVFSSYDEKSKINKTAWLK